MKQYIIFTLLTVVFLFSFSFAYAQEDTTIGTTQARPSLIKEKVEARKIETRNLIEDKRSALQERNVEARNRVSDKRADLEAKRVDAKEKLAEKKEERKQKLNEKAKQRINAYVTRIVKRLDAALDRLEKIAVRVGTRIEKLEDKFADRGIDLSEAERLLGVVDTKIAEARESISSIVGAVDGALDTDNPKESFTAVRELIKSAIDSVKSAHRALVEAIKAVKAGVGTPSNTSQEQENEDTDENIEVED